MTGWHGMQMLDSVEGPVHHLAYERGEDVIVMKGYKFAKAKTAAAATLGCLALANSAVATQLVQVLACASGLKLLCAACSLLCCIVVLLAVVLSCCLFSGMLLAPCEYALGCAVSCTCSCSCVAYSDTPDMW